MTQISAFENHGESTVAFPGALREKCAAVKHPQHRLVRWRISNGHYQYRFYCDRCRRCVTPEIDPKGRLFIGKGDAVRLLAPDSVLADLPVMADETVLRQCYACDAIAFCEDHHVAERAIHGEFADRFPVLPLCPKCHTEATQRFQAFIQRLRGESAA